MDTETLVERQIEDGAALVKALHRAGFPMAAALWLRTSEAERWYLYVVSPLVDDEDLTRAYRRAHSTIREMPPSSWIDPFDVKLVGLKNPMAKAVLDVLGQRHDRHPIRYGERRLGDVSIEGAYIYPLPVATEGS